MKQNTQIHIAAVTSADLADVLSRRFNKGLFHAKAAYRHYFKTGEIDCASLPEFEKSSELAQQLDRDLDGTLPAIVETQSDDGVTKFTARLADGGIVESVLVPMFNHTTVCVSSQVGCRMGCLFCETGRMGFSRNLAVHEIVGQVLLAKWHFNAPVRNIVFMGMGEPMDNYDAVIQAIHVLADQRGINISPKRVTLSTVGLLTPLKRYLENPIEGLKLSISLNAVDDQLRSRLMPINQHHSLDDLCRLLKTVPHKAKEGLMFGYVLFSGINDSKSQALELARFAHQFPNVRVNLIPYNPIRDTPFSAASPERVEQFRQWLIAEKVFVRKRVSKGADIMAACGQLGARYRPEKGDNRHQGH